MEGATLKNWVVGQKLGKGACAEVFVATPTVPIKNSPPAGYVIKVAAIPANPKTQKGKAQMRAANSLYAEYMVYTKLFKCKGIPFLPLHAYGDANKNRYIVLERLGRTLADIVDKEGPIPCRTAARLGYDIVQSIEQMHAKNVVYVDIKPDNFMVSHGVENQVYCADFGLCDTYINATKREHKKQVFGSVVGTPSFLSVDCHQGSNAARKDDLESLIYVLVYMMKGTLPWMHAKSDQEGATIKKNTSTKELCQGLNPIWQTVLDSIRAYAFEDKPEYAWIMSQFKTMMTKDSGPYEWN